ncbi:hypothetical protein PybrP1_012179 [[Pythium] brassicae (nom. inval.)]|nr:hypothetical protein PybrP1_012179 [[Pythium] brassicae (nom. inval.)]
MQWTNELNDLLNQCVFECGYEFRDASRLLQSRARTLRLLPDQACVVTADECQVQWMVINPVEDDPDCDWHDGDEGGGDLDGLQQMLAGGAFGRGNSVAECEEPLTDSTTTEPEVDLDSDEEDETIEEAVKPVATTAATTSADASNAELDLLLSSLPAATPEDDAGIDDSSAVAKNGGHDAVGATPSLSTSEMQWVLSFLTDPDAAAHQDADAKCLLQSVVRHDDDSYQFFLQELDQANLLLRTASADAKPTAEDASKQRQHVECVGLDTISINAQAGPPLASRIEERGQLGEAAEVPSCLLEDDTDHSVDDDDDDDDDEWDTVRRSMKSQAVKHPANPTTGVARSRQHVGDKLSPPPAPVPRARSSLAHESADTQPQQLAALSQEIGDLLKTHGAFHFPKRLFPHHSEALELDT